MYNQADDFMNWATKHLGISSLQLEAWRRLQDTLYSNSTLVQASVTPNIVEERQLNVAVMDVFSRLLMDRIIWVAGPVDDRMSIVVQAQLMFLSQYDKTRTITMHIDSPGGSVKAGLSMVDVMEYIPNPIETINTGMAASMGSVLLGAGTKGMRSSLRHSRTMLHQSSGGAGGNIQDARISFEEWEKLNTELFNLLGGYCDKRPKQVMKDASRDLWLSAEDALEYGIIDEVIEPRPR
jgi:ATP-dependent Clp protease protease subunit